MRRNYNLLKQAARTLQLALRRKKKKKTSSSKAEIRTSSVVKGERRIEKGGREGDDSHNTLLSSTVSMVSKELFIDEQMQLQQTSSQHALRSANEEDHQFLGDASFSTSTIHQLHQPLVKNTNTSDTSSNTDSSGIRFGNDMNLPANVNTSSLKQQTQTRNKTSSSRNIDAIRNRSSLSTSSSFATDDIDLVRIRREAEAAAIIARALQRYRGN